MATEASIQAGCLYSVKLPEFDAEVRVRTVCPDITRPGWWDCENRRTGQPITLPADGAIWQLETPADA